MALVVVALISGVTVAVVLGVGRSDSGRAAAGGEAADGSRSQAGFDWYSTRGRPARLPEPQGLYLDLRRDATDGRGGSESVGWAATRLHDVPVYFERRRSVGTGADLAITYWMLYAMSEATTGELGPSPLQP